MTEVAWERMKAQELRSLAERDAAVILPIASIEQHGPHLPVMTDTRLGQEVAWRAARIASGQRPVVVAPVVWSGLSEHHMPYGGTLTLSHATFRAVLRDLIEAITRHGFRHILISNSHGGNIVAMQQIIDELSPEVSAVLVGTTYVMEAGKRYAEVLEDQESVQHACEAETSMMMVCEPGLVDTGDLGALNTRIEHREFLGAGEASYRWRPFSHVTGNGVAGYPEKSSAEKGERLLEIGADALARLITDPATWAAPRDLRAEGTGGVAFRKR